MWGHRTNMKSRGGKPVPALLAATGATGLLLCSCIGAPDLRSPDPLVVTESTPASPAAGTPTAREVATAEMRAAAAAGDDQPYPDVFQPAQTNALAARGEPRSAAEVAAIEAELLRIARRRASASDAAEVAALEARARELRRLAAAAQSGTAQ
jgi:hypothetical protein